MKVLSFIDYPKAFTLQHKQTVIAGWCLRQDGVPIHAVRACLGDQFYEGHYGIPRPDVKAAFPDILAERSGYEIVVPVFPGSTQYRLEAKLGGTWQEFDRIRIGSSEGFLDEHSPGQWSTRVVPGMGNKFRTGWFENLSRHFLSQMWRNQFVAFDPDCAFRSWIDRPCQSITTTRKSAISGWCFQRGGTRITAVRVRINGVIQQGHYGLPRPDVANIHGEIARSSGFEIALNLPRGIVKCKLEVQSEDGTWFYFRTLRLVVLYTKLHDERLHWRRFWRAIIKGDRAAWCMIREDERKYLLASALCRGCLSLGVWVQHAPRAVVTEKFSLPTSLPENLPGFTIVTPSFNQAVSLEAAMRSVLDQTGVRIDYIVQDGGSTDGSVEVIHEIAEQYANAQHSARLVRWASGPDGGQADALRRGFECVSGRPDDLMAYLNSDDAFMPNALRFVAEYFADHPEVDVVYGHRVIIDESGREIGRWYTPRAGWDDVRFYDLIPQETIFWRRRIWDAVGGIDVSFQFALDWDLLLRFRSAGARFARLPFFLGQFRFHIRQKTNVLLESHGIPEMKRLRLRTFGKSPTQEELQSQWDGARFDSAIVQALFLKGRRV